jgi:hypothetical protein
MKVFRDDCTEVENSLALAVGGDLEPALRAHVEEHLARCAACAERARALSESRRALVFGLRADDPRAPDLWPGIQAALQLEGRIAARGEPVAIRSSADENADENAGRAIARRAAARGGWRWARYGTAAAAAVLAGFVFGRLGSPTPKPAIRDTVSLGSTHAPELAPTTAATPIIPVSDRAMLHRVAPGEPRLSDTAQNFDIEWTTNPLASGSTSVGSPASLQPVQLQRRR